MTTGFVAPKLPLGEPIPGGAELADILPKVELVEEDNQNLESDWHCHCMSLLLESIRFHFRQRDDYYAGGDMFIYFSEQQARDRDFRGPDFFYVDGVPREPLRRFWVVWQEGGRYPNVIIELLSPTTAVGDRTTKKDVYEKTFRTPEYYCYDPATERLEGWRLTNRRYQPIPAGEDGRLWSEELGLWVGRWRGAYQQRDAVWLRFFHPSGEPVLTGFEFEHQRAETERRRAEAAEQELARLRAQLPRQKPDQPG
jgi:Uma2 family endonuclease